MRARAPASSANLGPGFDTLALALALYTEVEVKAAEHLIVRSEGEGAEFLLDSSHLAAQVAMSVVGHDRLAITVRSSIPVGRGLGSSAALAVAAAAAAGAKDPLAVAAEVEGHPENAAASVFGGLVTATTVAGEVVASPLNLDPELAFVVMVPEVGLPTTKARAALASEVSHADATFNLGRMGLLVAGLADHHRLRREATEDRLHQGARSPLFPEASRLLAGLMDAGALATCWSGAGPSLLAMCEHARASQVCSGGDAVLRQCRVQGRCLVLQADTDGLVIRD